MIQTSSSVAKAAARGAASPGDHVAVIGGGVIGGMSAWYLARAGYRVTVIERDAFGAACSHGNCGYICPSHILPLCQPGAVTKTMRAMLKPNSPFAVKPRLSKSFVSWFWNFTRSCNERDMMETGRALHGLLQSSLSLYRELVNDDGVDCEWQEHGLLFVHDDANAFQMYAETDRMLREEFGVGATPYDGESALELEPALKPGIAGAWHYEGDCHLRPDKLLEEIRQRLEGMGVEFLESTSVESFEKGGPAGGASRVVAKNGAGERITVDADHFVVATGAMTPFLNEHLGVRIPIEPGKGYSITMTKPGRMPKYPLIFEDSHVAVTPMETGYRIGSTMEFVGYDTSINQKRLGLLTAAAEKHLVDPLGPEVTEEWYGWRPMTWDGRPIIDRSPAHANVWIAAGHSMLGLSMATGTGRLVTEMIGGGETHLDPAPFRVSRFH
ncbi:D-amino acid dehydrogenase small subunit [Planctomycetes bacterium Poly30]|uniref:D-amino acid dehydrogenase small subunit n=1 Tax=Saltatorellus ferox TaxID=2528018 RepID=A0A518EMX3_9BACT|nr:D-amino acid dehydrogenase small subunit [Planctomycetes bacterium Poly30]